MTVSLMPLLIHKKQPRWKYYLSCHFVAVSSWLIMKSNYKKIEKKYKYNEFYFTKSKYNDQSKSEGFEKFNSRLRGN